MRPFADWNTRLPARGGSRCVSSRESKRPFRQLHGVLAGRLHALGGDRPDRGLRVGVVPRRGADLGGAGRGEYREIDREHGASVRVRAPLLRDRRTHLQVR